MWDNSQMELRSWQKTLDVLQQENVLLKHKVTELLKEGVHTVALEKIEFYLNILLDKDAVLALLRHEIAGYLRDGYKKESPVYGVADATKERLGKDVVKMEQEFQKLKAELTNYVSAMLAAS